MRLATVSQSKEIDELSQKVYGLSADILMESAGAMAAREIDQAYFPELSRGLVTIVCGPGNNGGDGLVLARHLHSTGHRNLVVLYFADSNTSELFQKQLQRAELHGIKTINAFGSPEKTQQMKSATLIVDALFGIGLSRPIEGEFTKVVDLMNSSKVPVISLDSPSGLNCDTGVVEGATVKAAMTLSFGLAKPGFFVADGPGHTGKVRILPIGFPYESLRGVATSHFLFNDKLARRYLPSRADVSNKSDHGRLLLLAGSPGMWGAGVLAALSAYRMGCGYVTWAGHGEAPLEKIAEAPEVLMASEDSVKENIDQFSAVAIGPGFGVNANTAQWIQFLKEKNVKNVVLDADAITTCVQNQLFPLPESWVITPHAGELSGILKISSKVLNRDRYSSATQAAEACGCHVVFKGFRSVIAYKKRCMVVNSGNSSLAKAGTGDVLTGMIASLLAQGTETLQGTATATYVHGRISDEWVRMGNDKSTLVASDLTHHLPQLLSRLSGGTLF